MSMGRQWRLAARPVGKIRESDFELVEVPIPEAADGQFVVAITQQSSFVSGSVAVGCSQSEKVYEQFASSDLH